MYPICERVALALTYECVNIMLITHFSLWCFGTVQWLEDEIYFSLTVWSCNLYGGDDDYRINVEEYLTRFKAKLLVFFNIAMDLLGFKITRTHNLLFQQPFTPKMWFKHLEFDSCSVEYPIWVTQNYVSGLGPVHHEFHMDAYNFEADHLSVLKYHTRHYFRHLNTCVACPHLDYLLCITYRHA